MWGGRLRAPIAGVLAVGVGLAAAGCGADPRRVAPVGAPTTTPSPTTTFSPATPGPTTSGSPVAAPADTLTLAFAGDVHFEGAMRRRLGDPGSALAGLPPALAAADLSMVNLETSITARGTPQPKKYHFRTSPAALEALRAAGVDVVSMANNHAVDFGAAGLADTLAATRRSPVPVVGIGRDAAAAFAPRVLEAAGRRVAFVAATQVPDYTSVHWPATVRRAGVASALDPTRLLAAVRRARARADVVVVYLHWGVERVRCPTREQVDLAGRLSRAGADVVVGSHAHVLLGSGRLGRSFVAYGLGNFVWPAPNSAAEATSGVLTLTLRHRRELRQDWAPATISRAGLPQPVTGSGSRAARAAYGGLRGCAGLAGAEG